MQKKLNFRESDNKNNNMISEILNKKNEGHVSSGKFSISSVGSCFRKKYLELKGLYHEEFGIEAQRIFNIGNVVHRQIIAELIEKESPDFHLVASEINIPEHKYLSGRIDAIACIKEENVIIDIKSAGSWTMKKIRESGEVDDNYKDQVLLYMHLTGIHKGMLLFVGKEKGDLEEVMVEYNETRAKRLLEEIENFFKNYVEKNIEPTKCNGGSWGCDCCGVKKQW